VGYLPQDPNTLLFADRVIDELEITLRNHGMWPEQGGHPPIEPKALLSRLGLAHKVQAYPRDLSVGERQRVALAAITVTQPGSLLLDEPTRGLDYSAKEQLMVLLHGWRDQQMAIVVITHDVEFAAAIADRVVLMSQGEIIANGSAERSDGDVAALCASGGAAFSQEWVVDAAGCGVVGNRRLGEIGE
jgi:energy-coupling factor transporter ATP-binding protein EcfA2